VPGTPVPLELAIVECVSWFNNQRLHSSIGDIPPAEYEQLHADLTLPAAIAA
jgi:putative transposase